MKTMDAKSAQIASICECIDHCFAFAMWCDEFAKFVDPEDLVAGLDTAFDLVSDSTRLQSFLATRKLNDFLGGVKPHKGDLVATDFGIDVPNVLGGANVKFLSEAEREKVNKQVAHLTEQLTLDPETEVELEEILKRSIQILSRLVSALRKADTSSEATQWLDRTDTLLKRVGKS